MALTNTGKEKKYSWPNSTLGETKLTFSGYLNTIKINAEKTDEILKKIFRIVLKVFIALAFVSLCFLLYGFTQSNADNALSLITNRGPVNFALWVGVFAGMYLWADKKHESSLAESMHSLKTSTEVDVYKLFNTDAKKVWNNTAALSNTRKLSAPGALELFDSLLEDEGIAILFARFSHGIPEIQSLITEASISYQRTEADSLDNIPYLALGEALKLRNNVIDSVMLLCALATGLPETHPIQTMFYKIDLDLEKLEIVSAWNFNLRKIREDLHTFSRFARFKTENGVNKSFTSVPTPHLDQFSRDLTFLAKHRKLPFSTGRQDDLNNILTLFSEGRRNVLINGQPGTGRSTTVEELAYKMVTEDVPELLQDKRLVKLDLSALIGSKLPPEQVLINALQEAERSGNIVLAMEEIHILAKATTAQNLNLLVVFLDYMQKSQLLCIATSTLNDYQDFLIHSENFSQIFSTYELTPLTHNAIILATCMNASALETRTNVFFTYLAIETAVSLTDKFFKDAGQPQKAINVLVEAANKAHGQSAQKLAIIDSENIQIIVGEKAHIPLKALSTSEADKILNLENELRQHIIGQSEAIKKVAEVIRRTRSGLAAAGRPLASLLFVGPTGVGKTELAKTLVRTYFGKDEYFLRLDMSEYQGNDGLQKLLGANKSDTDTIFIKHLKNYPYCLFLLDEFEKSSLEVKNLFLQILEDGRLTTVRGEVLDLTQTIIIATSNAGTMDIQNGLAAGQTLEQIKPRLFNEILLKFFSPELLNRFDSVILFTPLSPAEVEHISKLQLDALAKLMDENKGIVFTYTEAAAKFIAAGGFDPLLGARPIRRYIQDHVEDLIAKALLSQTVKKGDRMNLDVSQGQLVLN